MKKMVFVIVVSVLFIMAALLTVSVIESSDHIKQLEAEYDILAEKTLNRSGTANELELASAYARLFDQISKGDKKQETEYAELFRRITQNSVSFDDSDVFTIAESYSRYYTEVAAGKTDFGVEQIDVSSSANRAKLQIAYSGVRGYSVKMLSEKDTEYSGDYQIAYNGALGKYRIAVTFYDTDASDAFKHMYPKWEVHDIENNTLGVGNNLKMKCVSTPGHAFVIYIGSDSPIIVEEKDFTPLILAMGSIEIDIKSR